MSLLNGTVPQVREQIHKRISALTSGVVCGWWAFGRKEIQMHAGIVDYYVVVLCPRLPA